MILKGRRAIPSVTGRSWRLRLVVGVVVALVVGSYIYLQTPSLWFMATPAKGAVPVSVVADPSPRLLVLAPHPDDDVLAVGGTIAEAVAKDQAVLIVYLTSGDANEWSKDLITWDPFSSAAAYRALGTRREKEALRALSILGVHPEQAIFLRYPDSGLTALWSSDWSESHPFRSPFTHRSAPTTGWAFIPGDVYCGQDLLRDLVKIILTFRPTVVYLPHPTLDVHPDHHATALFGEKAILEANMEDPAFASPEVRAYLVHAARGDWPAPRRLRLGLSLDAHALCKNGESWDSVPLSASVEKLKLRAVRAHFSQDWFSGGRFMASFVRSNEIYEPIREDGSALWTP